MNYKNYTNEPIYQIIVFEDEFFLQRISDGQLIKRLYYYFG